MFLIPTRREWRIKGKPISFLIKIRGETAEAENSFFFTYNVATQMLIKEDRVSREAEVQIICRSTFQEKVEFLRNLHISLDGSIHCVPIIPDKQISYS